MKVESMARMALVALVSAGALLAPVVSWAQPGPPPPDGVGWRGNGPPPPPGPHGDRRRGPGPDAQTRELLEQVMLARVSKELSLDDEQTVIMVRRFAEHKEEMRALLRERGARMRALSAAVRGNVDAATLEEALEAVQEADARIMSLKFSTYESLGEGLTAWQRARLYLFITEFEDDMRRLVQQARDRARLGGEGPPPGRGPRRGGPPPEGDAAPPFDDAAADDAPEMDPAGDPAP